MLRLITAAVLLLFAAPALADPADISAASRSVVRIVIVETDGDNVFYVGHGSGVAIAPNLVLTNAHVVEPLREDDTKFAGVVPSEGKRGYVARIAAYSPGNDLALLRLAEAGSIAPAALFPGEVASGAHVYALGYPGNVDAAQGLDLSQIVRPTAAVLGEGYISGGRSSNSFDTLLHTASIGAGNSGGPLLDDCGRVIGINSFGTVSDNGTDASFYFAVSMREITRFLREAGVTARLNSAPCRSLADLNRSESERFAAEAARLAATQQGKERADAAARDKARTQAEREVLDERDNRLALAVLMLVAAMGAGGAAFLYAQRGNDKALKISGGIAAALVLGAGIAWFSRPTLSSIDERAEGLVPTATDAARPAQTATAGKMICVIDPERSRVTVSDAADVPLEWSDTGCVNTRTQYGLGTDGWSRIFVPGSEETVSVSSYDPASRTYKVERFLLGYDAMVKARAERGKFSTPQCSAGQDGARKLGESQAAIKALLPPQANERLLYNCTPVK